MADFTLPELGEDLTSGEVLRVLVKPGDKLEKDQTVLELETDKATIEVPSSVAGRVTEVKVKAGDKVKVGQVVLSVEDTVGPSASAGAPAQVEGREAQGAPSESSGNGAASTSEASAKSSGKQRSDERGERPQLELSGESRGSASAGSGRPEPKAEGGRAGATGTADRGAGAPEALDNEPEQTPLRAQKKVVDISRGARLAAEPTAPETPPAPAAPSVRRMARELGVDIDDVPGTDANGRISVDDVKAYAKRLLSAGSGRSGAVPAGAPLPDFSRWGEIDRQPMRAVRRKTAEHLSVAWATIPHVTQHDLADVTAVDELRKKYAPQAEAAGGNLTITAIAVKVVAAALKQFPHFNASVDLRAEEIIYKKYVNIGIAVDTDRGLLVPVVRHADTKNIIQLSVEIAELSEKARTRKIALEDMQGGCFSVSNLGGIGGTYFTPIVNAPEVAILGISRARMEPVWKDGEFIPRLMLPLSLSYDHRAIDGADGARFLRWVIEALEQPFLLALQG